MEEIILRRYKRLIDENKSLPQLIVIDGGKGQLSSAVHSLEILNLRGKITVVGIAKRLEEIYYPDDQVPLYLDKNSETLRVLQHLRNEAHRFGITFHRDKRSKKSMQSELDIISGIGPKTIEILLKNFNSVMRIKQSSFDDLAGIIGQSKARIIKNFFESN
jgi:excinuclease ABC subunit C